MTTTTDIYLNCNASNLSFAQTLKKDLESKSGLSITIENDDWESDEDEASESSMCDFLDNIDMARQMIIIHAENTTLTAWVIDPNFRTGRGIITTAPKPHTVVFTNSYKAGMESLLNVLRRSNKGKLITKQRKSRGISSLWKQTKSATSGVLLLAFAILFAK